MCLGAQARAANENARRRYKYENERRERNWMQTISIYNAKKVKYEEDADNANLAIVGAATEKQEAMNLARGEAQIKYAALLQNLLKDSAASKLIASGQTGQSTRRRKVMDYAEYGQKVGEIGRQLMLNDRELARKTAKQQSQYKQFKDQAFAKVAFQPIPDVEPPQPVMQSVGAAAFMDALSIGSSIAGIYGAFNPTGSDRRLKENIKKIGESISGLGIYTFNYIGKATKYIGTMADEVLKVKPEAVIVRNGYMAVNYDLIDVNFEVA